MELAYTAMRKRAEEAAIRIVMEALERAYGVTAKELVSSGRPDRIAWPRMVGMACLAERYGLSQEQAARAFGRRCHSSVRHAIDAVRDRSDTCLESRKGHDAFIAALDRKDDAA